MPSLTPAKPLARSIDIDIIATFKSEQTASTRGRVIDYLFPIYEQFSDLPVEKIWSKDTVHEELHIPMPTVAAYRSEIELCNGILEHSRGACGDAVMLTLLREFKDAHTWIYHPDGPRTNKVGSWPDWARVQLYTLSFVYQKDIVPPELNYPVARVIDEKKAIICNSIQAWIIRLLEERRGASGFALEKL